MQWQLMHIRICWLVSFCKVATGIVIERVSKYGVAWMILESRSHDDDDDDGRRSR